MILQRSCQKRILLACDKKPETLPKDFALMSIMMMLGIFCSNAKMSWCLQAAVERMVDWRLSPVLAELEEMSYVYCHRKENLKFKLC